MDRRFKRVEIAPEVLVNMLKGGTWSIEENPLPQDARLLGGGVNIEWDPRLNIIVLLVESKKYEPTPMGEIIPEAPLTVFRNHDHGAQGGPGHDCDGEGQGPVEPGDNPSRAE